MLPPLMLVEPGINAVAPLPQGTCVAIGNFDGLHVGHRALITATLAAAARSGGLSTVLTFEPHPARLFAPDKAPPPLTSPSRKIELLDAAGVACVVFEPFTADFAATSADAFVDLLVDRLQVRSVIVGYDFTYGQKRAGTALTLRAAGAARGFAVEVIAPVLVGDAPASSSRVRAAITRGDLADVRACLGRDHDVDGTVVHGAGRGRTIGVPTANVATSAACLPPPGVYAVRVEVDGRTHDGVANLGRRPTFEGDAAALSLEVHLFDYQGDLYDAPIRVAFAHRLRDERRFTSVDALIAQIHTDMTAAREALAHG